MLRDAAGDDMRTFVLPKLVTKGVLLPEKELAEIVTLERLGAMDLLHENTVR